MKSLVTDTAHKVDAEIDKHRSRKDFPVFYGSADLQKVLSHLPDGEAIYRRIYGAITRSVEDAIRTAEDQITQTKHALGLAHSASMLIILNDAVGILNPDAVCSKVASLLQRPRTGHSAAEIVDFVWMIFESHVIGNTKEIRNYPSILMLGDGSAKHPWFQAFFDDLQAKWAEANKALLLDLRGIYEGKFSFDAVPPLNQSPPLLRQHEAWRLEYDAKPHLRGLSDEEVLAHGGQLIAAIAPYLTKGGPAMDMHTVLPLMREFTCFLQEASFRGLDMQQVPKF